MSKCFLVFFKSHFLAFVWLFESTFVPICAAYFYTTTSVFSVNLTYGQLVAGVISRGTRVIDKPTGGVAQWLGRRSLAGGLFLTGA